MKILLVLLPHLTPQYLQKFNVFRLTAELNHTNQPGVTSSRIFSKANLSYN